MLTSYCLTHFITSGSYLAAVEAGDHRSHNVRTVWLAYGASGLNQCAPSPTRFECRCEPGDYSCRIAQINATDSINPQYSKITRAAGQYFTRKVCWRYPRIQVAQGLAFFCCSSRAYDSIEGIIECRQRSPRHLQESVNKSDHDKTIPQAAAFH